MQETGRPGTVRYYGCPAEETGAGKVFMARAGVFDDLDAAFTWHPWQNNTVWVSSSLAVDHLTFRFHGETAHAAGSPETGRSALDAVELMNVGVNFLREHMIEKARIHYVITNGGGQPNVVPAEAEVWYYVRAPQRDQVDALTARVRKCAEGAALMTETRLEVLDAYGVHNYLPSFPLSDLTYEVLEELGPLEFTEEEKSFARTISDAFPESNRLASLRGHDLPTSILNDGLYGAICPMGERGKVLSGSTDVSEVSWIAPTVQVLTTCFALGIPGHSWAVTATGGMSIGHKGMLHAAKTMAVSAADLWDNPELLAKAKADHADQTGGRQYVAPIPEGAAPPKPHI
jgi:aminobenzoyl-glutamate utilization protein B